jgi:hypothetical protein
MELWYIGCRRATGSWGILGDENIADYFSSVSHCGYRLRCRFHAGEYGVAGNGRSGGVLGPGKEVETQAAWATM